MYNTGYKTVICENARKCEIEFSRVLQSLCTAKSKNKSDTFIYTFSTNLCLNYSFKNCFQEHLLVKVINIKKHTLHALNRFIPGGNKRSQTLKQTFSF